MSVRVSTGGVHPAQTYCGSDAGLVNRYARAVSPIASARVQRKRCDSAASSWLASIGRVGERELGVVSSSSGGERTGVQYPVLY